MTPLPEIWVCHLGVVDYGEAIALQERLRAARQEDEVPDVLAGLGTSILTTSRGVMTGRAAVKAGVGGEVLCNIW